MVTQLDGILANRIAFESDNVDFVHAQISRYFKPHKIRFIDEQKRDLKSSLRRANVGSIAVSILEYGGSVMIDPGAFEDFYLVHVNVAGKCELAHDGGHMTVDSRYAAVCTPHRQHQFWWQQQSRVLAIQIPRQRLLNHFRDLTGIMPREEIDFDLALDLATPAARSFTELLQYLLRDAGTESGLTADPITAEPLERALMTALLRAQPGSHQNAMSTAGGCTAPGYVIRAEAYMRENLDRAVRMEELAGVCGVTDRTLTSGFNRFRGDTPARYFLSLRLAEARRRLIAGKGNATVSDIAFELGFHHLSSFAAAYRERYDEMPSQTLKQIPAFDGAADLANLG